MHTGHIKVMTAKLRQFIDIDEELALVGTIKFGRRPAKELEETGGRFDRKPTFAVPTPCSDRPVSADGRVAFHFKHTFVVKKAQYPGSTKSNRDSLVVSGDGEGHSTDAAEHERYISREDAVMTITAAAYDEYIEAGGIEERGGAIFTNIHPELEKRVDFWKAVARCERTPSPDVVTFHFERLSSDQWQELLQYCAGQRGLTNLGQRLRHKAWTSGETGTEVYLEDCLFKRLCKKLKRMDAWDKARPPVTIKRGRGGRIQRRIVAEFPLGLEAPARLRIIQKFAGVLESYGMMYTAVIHAPDHHNDKRNFHLHVAAHDRPSRYLEEHGCWDFEYREPVVGQSNRFHHPYRQNKIAALTRSADGRGNFRKHGADIFNELRRTFAEICNDELRASGVNRLFDPRSYAKMGIDQEPGSHLGNKASALEAAGIPTALGIENAERSWQGAFDRTAKDHKVSQQLRNDCRRHAEEILRRLTLSGIASPIIGELSTQISAFDEAVTALGTQEHDLAELYFTAQMAYSRADKTIEVCQRLLEAIENGGASHAEREAEDKIRERLREAYDHQDRIHTATHADIEWASSQVVEVNRRAGQLDATLKEMKHSIDHGERLLADQASLPAPVPAVARHDRQMGNARARYSREVAAYFQAPLDYEEEWDRIFMRLKLEEVEIHEPTEKTPHFHVLGIDKQDLDRLMNPIFRKRSQARLQAMCEFQKLNKTRAERRSQSRLPAEEEVRLETIAPLPIMKEAPVEVYPDTPPNGADSAEALNELAGPPAEKAPAPTSHEARYEELARASREQRDKDKSEAIRDWFAWFREHYKGKAFPVKFEGGKPVLELDAIPEDRRKIPEVFTEQATALVDNELAAFRSLLRQNILGASRLLVRTQGDELVYNPEDFFPELQPHLKLLLNGDPRVRAYIEEASNAVAAKSAEPSLSQLLQTEVANPRVARTSSVEAGQATIFDQAQFLAGKSKGRG